MFCFILMNTLPGHSFCNGDEEINSMKAVKNLECLDIAPFFSSHNIYFSGI